VRALTGLLEASGALGLSVGKEVRNVHCKQYICNSTLSNSSSDLIPGMQMYVVGCRPTHTDPAGVARVRWKRGRSGGLWRTVFEEN